LINRKLRKKEIDLERGNKKGKLNETKLRHSEEETEKGETENVVTEREETDKGKTVIDEIRQRKLQRGNLGRENWLNAILGRGKLERRSEKGEEETKNF
jgi:hypothetical protein